MFIIIGGGLDGIGDMDTAGIVVRRFAGAIPSTTHNASVYLR